MVVSTLLPVQHRGARAAVAEVRGDQRVVVRREPAVAKRLRARRSGGSCRGSRSAARRTPRATRAAPRRCRPRAASSGGTPCRRRPPGACRGTAPARSRMPSRFGGIVQRPERDALLDLRDHFGRDGHRARELRAAVHHAVADAEQPVGRAQARGAARPTSRSACVVAGAGDAAATPSCRSASSRAWPRRRAEALRDAGDVLRGGVAGR